MATKGKLDLSLHGWGFADFTEWVQKELEKYENNREKRAFCNYDYKKGEEIFTGLLLSLENGYADRVKSLKIERKTKKLSNYFKKDGKYTFKSMGAWGKEHDMGRLNYILTIWNDGKKKKNTYWLQELKKELIYLIPRDEMYDLDEIYGIYQEEVSKRLQEGDLYFEIASQSDERVWKAVCIISEGMDKYIDNLNSEKKYNIDEWGITDCYKYIEKEYQEVENGQRRMLNSDKEMRDTFSKLLADIEEGYKKAKGKGDGDKRLSDYFKKNNCYKFRSINQMGKERDMNYLYFILKKWKIKNTKYDYFMLKKIEDILYYLLPGELKKMINKNEEFKFLGEKTEVNADKSELGPLRLGPNAYLRRNHEKDAVCMIQAGIESIYESHCCFSDIDCTLDIYLKNVNKVINMARKYNLKGIEKYLYDYMIELNNGLYDIYIKIKDKVVESLANKMAESLHGSEKGEKIEKEYKEREFIEIFRAKGNGESYKREENAAYKELISEYLRYQYTNEDFERIHFGDNGYFEDADKFEKFLSTSRNNRTISAWEIVGPDE